MFLKRAVECAVRIDKVKLLHNIFIVGKKIISNFSFLKIENKSSFYFLALL